MKNGRVWIAGAIVAGLPFLTGASTAGAGIGDVALPGVGAVEAAGGAELCAPDPDPPEYYRFPLVTTKNVPGSARASGVADVTYAPASPFGVSVSPDGSYRYDVHVSVEDLRAPDRGVYTVWVTTSQIDEIRRVGTLGEDGAATGQVDWNKFLVVITLEPEDDPDAETWSGPVVLRGMSRSGMMHTMAGHGPFQQENCAAYGYDD